MSQVEPLTHISSMRFESKHRELKVTSSSITNRKNICYTLSLKHQLKLAYNFISQSYNLNNTEINIGRTINLSLSTVNKLKILI